MDVIDRSHWSDRWRRVGRLVLALGIGARIVVGIADPATIVTALAMAGAAALLARSSSASADTRLRAVAVGDILETSYPNRSRG